MSLSLVTMVHMTGVLDTESSGVTSTAVVESFVVVVLPEMVVGVCEFDGGRPGHSCTMWPFWRHLKHLPSFRSCSCLSSVNHLNGSRV